MDETDVNLEPETEKVDMASANRQILWILILMGVLIAVVIGVFVYRSMSTKFEYEGLTFQKEKFDKLDIYHYSYSLYHDDFKKVVQYNLYLLNDPRKNDIPVYGKIEFPETLKSTYLSINTTNLEGCENSTAAVGAFGDFLYGNNVRVKGASPDEEFAKANNLTYATCENKPTNMVILIQEGEQTKIERNGEMCYIISVAQCDIRRAVEKFEVQALIDVKDDSDEYFSLK